MVRITHKHPRTGGKKVPAHSLEFDTPSTSKRERHGAYSRTQGFIDRITRHERRFFVHAALAAAALASPVLGAVATFTATGPTTVLPGTAVAFDITLSVQVLPWFNSADVIIGSNDAAFEFSYSTEWYSSIATVVAVAPAGLYPHDVHAGGENPDAVGSSLVLGRVLVDTTGLPDGDFQILISSDNDGGSSALRMAGLGEPIHGTGTFVVDSQGCALVGNLDGDCDVDLFDFRELEMCLKGPGGGVEPGCESADLNADGNIDLGDFASFQESFTGTIVATH